MSSRQDATSRVSHLIGDVQRFGLLSAATIVDRYIDTVDRAIANPPFGSGSASPDPSDPPWLLDGAARLADAGAKVLDTMAALITNGGQVTVAPDGDRLVLPAARPGSSSEISLWVHNPTSSPAVMDLHVTSLVSSTGRTIPAVALALSPQRIDQLAAEGRQEVRLRVVVPADQPEGHYHGLVLSSAAPTEPLPLWLDVRAPAGQVP